jgi:F-type H+-transporting ATPase subunit a
MQISALDLFAAGDGVPLSAETIYSLGSFNITNSMLMGVLVALVLVISFSIAAVNLYLRPKSRFSFFLESIIVFVKNNITNSFGGDEARARRFLPLFAAFFLFILLNNLGGLLPGMGGAIYVTTEEGIKAALLRPFTTDLNGTLALAAIAMITVEIISIRERGLGGYFKHFFTVMQPWYNPINFFIGIIELLGELIRMITLAFRLFGVIYAGEVLLHVIMNISGNFAPVAMFPVILMEIFFSFIQAYLFIMLSSTYLAIGSAHDEDHQSEPMQGVAVDNTATSKV